MLEKLRRKRRDELERYDLGGVYDDIAQELREVVDMERAGPRRAGRGGAGVGRRAPPGDHRRGGRRSATCTSTCCRPTSPARCGSSRSTTSPRREAREKFEELVDQLRQQLMQSYFNQMAGAMSDVSPEDMAADEGHAGRAQPDARAAGRGEEPDFDEFMERYGDFFPENPQNLDELLEVMAQRMAAMQAMLNSMTPEQRAQLQGLAEQLLEDMDLRWQIDQLGQNLQQPFPDAGLGPALRLLAARTRSASPRRPQLMDELGDIDQLENLLRGATNPGALAEVDIDRARELLGDDAARSLERLAELAKMLEEAGLIEQREGRYELTPGGIRRIGQNALSDLFQKLAQDKMGGHEIERTGVGHERAYETKPYEFGDPFNLHIERTVRNAIGRAGRRHAGAAHARRLRGRAHRAARPRRAPCSCSTCRCRCRCATTSSPPRRWRWRCTRSSPRQFPRDFLGIVGFSEVARELKRRAAARGVVGLRLRHQHAARLPARPPACWPARRGTKQIIMITDGEPTAHITAVGRAALPLPAGAGDGRRHAPRGDALHPRGHPHQHLHARRHAATCSDFVEKLTQLNRGRAFFTTPETLGDYVLVDFIEQRRQLQTPRPRAAALRRRRSVPQRQRRS